MADSKLIGKLAHVPLVQPGFDAFGMSAPVIVQMNPDGKWENTKPKNLDEERLKAVVQHLVKSKALSAAQSYCCQCASENKTPALPGQSQYIPVIMMPIYPADQCPFDMECEVQKIRDAEKVKPAKKTRKAAMTEQAKVEDKEKRTGIKKRGHVMQRLTDFDLLSQW